MPSPVLSAASATRTDPVSLLRSLIAIPSLTGEEGPAADYIEGTARAAGVDVWRHDDNVVLSAGSGENTLLWNSHLDVVPPSAGHPYDAFDPVMKDGWIYGRGSVDAKASGAAMVSAFLQMSESGAIPAGRRLMVALTACEEGGGAYNGLESIRPKLPEPSAVVIGEPTGLVPCVAQKGLLILKIHAHGTAAHAGRPKSGVNAISRASAAIQAIERLTLDRTDPFLGAPTVTVTTIEGGTARNAVPDHCVFAVDIRTTPAYTHEEIIAHVREVLAPLAGVEVEVYSNRFVPCATPDGSAIRAAALAACSNVHGKALMPTGSPTASDWIFMHDRPAVKLGPGESRRSHTAEERIRASQVHAAQQVYTDLAQTYFATGE